MNFLVPVACGQGHFFHQIIIWLTKADIRIHDRIHTLRMDEIR